MTLVESMLDLDLSINFSAKKEELFKAISHLQGVVERKNTVAILGNILFEAQEDNTIVLTTTDMEILASETINGVVNKAGRITIPAITLFEIVKKIDDGQVINISLTHSSNPVVEISSGRFNGKIPFMNPDNFPLMSIDDYTSIFEITSAELRNLIDKTKFSISNEETRYYLNGIYLHADDGFLCAVSTDLHRLSKAKITAPDGLQNFNGVIVPKKSIAEVRKLIDDFNGLLTIKVSPAKLAVEFDNISFISKLVDGQFPDYNIVIPVSQPNEFIINRSIFIKSLELVAIVAPDKTRNVKINISENKLLIYTTSEMYGNAQEEIEINYSGSSVEISFNVKYILEILSVIESDKVKISFSDSYSAVTIIDAIDTEGIALFIVMPTRG